MQRVDFYKLSRPIQDRVVAAMKGEGVPGPLLVSPSALPAGVLLWIAVGAFGLGAFVALYRAGLGDLDSAVAIHRPVFFALHAIFITALLVGILRGLALAWRTTLLPYRPGVYLFPTLVVDATWPQMRVHPLPSSVQVDTSHAPRVVLELPEGGTIKFVAKDRAQAEAVAVAMREAQDALAKATASGDQRAVGAFDPFAQSSFVNPLAPKKSLELLMPGWARFGWVIAPVAGAVLGVLSFTLRNASSDDKMFAKAKAANTSRAFQLYLARGGKKADVRDTLLPRAELGEAARSGSLEAVERFAQAHATSRIGDEVRDTLRTALLIELHKRNKLGTVSALTDFKKEHDTKLIAAEVDRAVHAMYRAAFERYRASAGNNGAAIALIDRLVDFAEKHGPRVELRFQRKISKTVELADNQIKKNPFFMGNPSLVSQYFDEGHARRREEEIGRKILARFSDAFAADVLKLEIGAPITDPEATLPVPTVPTLFVEHTVQVSGASYLNINPRGVFVGVGMAFDVSFRIPEDAKPFKWKTTTWRPPDMTIDRGSTPYEEAVYAALANDAFRLFGQRMLGTFFKSVEPSGPTAEASTTVEHGARAARAP